MAGEENTAGESAGQQTQANAQRVLDQLGLTPEEANQALQRVSVAKKRAMQMQAERQIAQTAEDIGINEPDQNIQPTQVQEEKPVIKSIKMSESKPTEKKEPFKLSTEVNKLKKGAGEWIKKHKEEIKIGGLLGLAGFTAMNWAAILPLLTSIGNLPIIAPVVGFMKGLIPHAPIAKSLVTGLIK